MIAEFQDLPGFELRQVRYAVVHTVGREPIVIVICCEVLVLLSPFVHAGAWINDHGEELLQQVESIAISLDGVHGVHDVIVHRYGQINLISLHIEVDEDRPTLELHDLSELVEETIEKKLGGSTVTHIDPVSKSHERYTEINNAVTELTDKDQRIAGFHDLRIVGHGSRIKAIFDINLAENVLQNETADITGNLRLDLAKRLPGVRTVIKVEPQFAYSRKHSNDKDAF